LSTELRPSAPAAAAPAPPPPRAAEALRVRGSAVAYRLYDVGYEIRLDRALDLLAASAPERVRPVRGEAQAIQIKDLPITVILGTESLLVAGRRHEVEVSARIFDFGVVSLRVRIPAPGELSFEEFTRFGNTIDAAGAHLPLFEQHLRLLVERIAPAVERFRVAQVTEDFIVYRISRLTDAAGAPAAAESLHRMDVAPLLLNEARPLSADARRELLPHRFSYYTDDLAILTWDNALIVDPSVEDDTDVQFILEFANAQLLELRFYDEADVAGAELQGLVADSTEIVERVENSLKVTDDVYLARVYTAALEIFRGRVWRAGIDRKLGIIRETYAMLNAEAQATRSEALELAIVLLIVAEIVLAVLMRR
jgi:hypothetical protein